jgi:hypothetical protein
MNELVRLPPPENQRDYEQWRQYVSAIDARDSAEALRAQQKRFFLMIIAMILVLAAILPQLARLLGFEIIIGDLILKFAFGTLALSAALLICATWLQWRMSLDKKADIKRMVALNQRLVGLKNAPYVR